MGLLIDNFAGGGGASFGLMEAFGRKVDIAINHDAKALAMHAVNHPETLHMCEDVFEVDPFEVCAGRSIDAAWFSPDCTHFSRAKGGKPVKKRIRGLAWVVMRWASLPVGQRPRVIFVENVEEFQTWGPLTDDGYPDKAKAGDTFRLWVKKLERRGYVVDWKPLAAWEYGAPTIRKRLFLVARCDGEPIRWPAPTHFNPKKPRQPGVRIRLKPWRTAAECIDWSLPCPSIFDRKKPLADNTLRRVARGTMRYVVDNPRPFIVPITHVGDVRVHEIDEPLRTVTTANGGEFMLATPFVTKFGSGKVGQPVDEPLATITANSFIKRPGGAPPLGLVAPILAGCGGRAAQSPEYAADRPMNTLTAKADQVLVAPTLIQTSYGERPGQAPRVLDLHRPLGTVVAGGGKHGLVASFLAQHNEGPRPGRPGRGADEPVSTLTTTGSQQGLVAAAMVNFKGTEHIAPGFPIDGPVPTICAGGSHVAEVRAFLLKYYGTGAFASDLQEPMHTATALPRFGLVVVKVAGVEYVIVDIGMRMLSPRELFLAQGFAPDYKIQVGWGPALKPLTKSDQIRMVGNSVSPPVAIAIAKANAPLMSRMRWPAEREVAIA